MTEHERQEEQREHWLLEKRILGMILGLLVTYGVGGVWWAATISQQVSALEYGVEQDRARLAATRADLQQVRVQESRTDQRLQNIESSILRQERMLEQALHERLNPRNSQ